MSATPSPDFAPADSAPVSAPPPLDENPRVTQALEEYLAALEAGQCPEREQFQARYPEIAEVLGGYLDGLEFMHRAAADMHASSSGPPADCGRVSPVEGAPLLGDYQILQEVGRGGMGIVYVALQRSLNRRVALKVLSLGATLGPRHLRRFQNEAQAAAHLQHPNIVPIFAVGCEQGMHYYAMRFIDGKTLSAFIQELRCDTPSEAPAVASTDATPAPLTAEQSAAAGGHGSSADGLPLPDSGLTDIPPLVGPVVRDAVFFRQAAWLGVQAAEALEHAHQMGVIHRDIKPANLLLDRAGHLWVTDFGLARWSADAALTTSGDLLGTLRYMSPEQASARRGLVDHRTDLYSLGATLYELLTLQPVCRGEDHQEVLQQVLHEEPVPPRRLCRDVPRDLETIVLKALGKSVEERYATAQELADDLRRFLEGRPILARRPALWDRAGKWARRHRPLVASAAVFLALGVLGLAAGTIAIGREQARTRAAYELEAHARQTEAEARARAEQNFRQARQLVDYISEIAAVDMAAESDLPNIRRKLLLAALSYYQDFLEEHRDNPAMRRELLRGSARVATLLDAIGRGDDARLAWNQVFQIASTLHTDEALPPPRPEPAPPSTPITGRGGQPAVFHLVPANKRLRLLRLAPVQQELKLSPEQVGAVLALESKRNEQRSERQGRTAGGPAASSLQGVDVEQEALRLLRPDQARRLNQLLLQQRGVWAFQDAAVIAALRLRPDQREAIAALRKKATASPPGQARDNKALMDGIVRLLTAEQAARWRGLIGEPFQGVLPPGDLVLVVGGMRLNIAPVGGSRK